MWVGCRWSRDRSSRRCTENKRTAIFVGLIIHLALLNSLTGVKQSWKQDVEWAEFSSEGAGEKPTSKHFWVVGRIQFSVVVGLRFPDCRLSGSSVHGILQAIILKQVAIPLSKGSSQPRDRILVSCIVGRFFTVWVTVEAQVSAYLLAVFWG